MSTLEFDTDALHPEFRVPLQRTVFQLVEVFPLYEEVKLTIDVRESSEFVKNPNSLAYTQQKEVYSYYINLNPNYFGLDADPSELRDGMKEAAEKKFHGSITDDGYVVTHEYGHVLGHMFVDRGIRDAGYSAKMEEPYDALANYAREQISPLDRISILMSAKQPSPAVLHALNTVYGLRSPDEFFAETIAIMQLGNEREKASKPVQLMRGILAVAYPK